MKKLLILIALILCLSITGFTQQQSKECKGYFRWDVKTLTDHNGIDLLLEIPTDSTIAQLVSVNPPVRMSVLSKKDGRLPRFGSEKYLVRVIALVEKINKQPDQDFHVLLRSPDSKASMIGEIPDPDCLYLSDYPVLKEKFRIARNQGDSVLQLLKNSKTPVLVEVTGVPFWDAPHFWLKGSSKGGREIHPILNMRILGQ